LKKITVIVSFFLFLGVMSGCSKNQTNNTTSGDTKATAITGDVVFQKSCIICHSSGDLSGEKQNLTQPKFIMILKMKRI
jgi:mono/diheme cytochrome c family protein